MVVLGATLRTPAGGARDLGPGSRSRRGSEASACSSPNLQATSCQDGSSNVAAVYERDGSEVGPPAHHLPSPARVRCPHDVARGVCPAVSRPPPTPVHAPRTLEVGDKTRDCIRSQWSARQRRDMNAGPEAASGHASEGRLRVARRSATRRMFRRAGRRCSRGPRTVASESAGTRLPTNPPGGSPFAAVLAHGPRAVAARDHAGDDTPGAQRSGTCGPAYPVPSSHLMVGWNEPAWLPWPGLGARRGTPPHAFDVPGPWRWARAQLGREHRLVRGLGYVV